VVDVVGVELLELDGADLRYQVLVDENPVRLDGAAVEIAGSFLEPVTGGFSDRVAVAGFDASVQVGYDPDQPFSDDRLGPAPSFDPDAVAAAIKPEVD